jgi:hypothetical protein
MSNIPEKVCYACFRIDGKQFYWELRELGFASADAAEIASWIKTIFDTQPAFLSGKKAPAVKACLAFIGSKIYSPKQALNYNAISAF